MNEIRNALGIKFWGKQIVSPRVKLERPKRGTLVNVRMHKPLHEMLVRFCKEENLTIAEGLRQITEDYLNQHYGN